MYLWPLDLQDIAVIDTKELMVCDLGNDRAEMKKDRGLASRCVNVSVEALGPLHTAMQDELDSPPGKVMPFDLLDDCARQTQALGDRPFRASGSEKMEKLKDIQDSATPLTGHLRASTTRILCKYEHIYICHQFNRHIRLCAHSSATPS